MTKGVGMKGSPTPVGLNGQAAAEISDELAQLLVDTFRLYVKTRKFYWHMIGHHFRGYRELLDEQAAQIFSITEEIAERARKIGGLTLRSISKLSRGTRLQDNDDENVTPQAMVLGLRDDNVQLAEFLRRTHEICGKHGDIATASLIEVWIDQAECRTCFLTEIVSEGE